MTSAIIGFRDAVVAKVLSDTASGATYDTPRPFAPSISGSVSANGSVTPIYTDDGPSESVAAIGEIEVEFEASAVPRDSYNYVLGHNVNADGVLEKSIQDEVPEVAFGFRALKANNKYHYVWLLKGKFSVPDEKYQTKDNNVSPQTTTIKGTFLRRKFDDKYEFTADDDDLSINQSVITNWLTEVYQPDSGVAVTSLTLDSTTATVSAGATKQLTATLAPANATDQNIIWTSSNNAEATVNGAGLVTVAAGATVGDTITITATSHADPSKTASCVITVGAAG